MGRAPNAERVQVRVLWSTGEAAEEKECHAHFDVLGSASKAVCCYFYASTCGRASSLMVPVSVTFP